MCSMDSEPPSSATSARPLRSSHSASPMAWAEEAQAFRWSCFEQGLNATHLRAHLKRLPDFDDIAAEERALSFVQASPRFHAALAFLSAWPALDRAAAYAGVTVASPSFPGIAVHDLRGTP